MPSAQAANVPSFESVWAALQENAVQIKELRESQKETNRILEETERVIKESQRETDRIIKENAIEFNRRIGHLDNLFGEVAEYMIAPSLREKFIELGYKFPKATQNLSVNDKENQLFLEIDVMLENGEKAMLVEVKAKLTKERINGHIERLEKMRRYADLHGDTRIFLGAVAGVVVTEESKNYTLDQGLYLIEPAGDSLSITPPNGKPKEW